MKTIRFATRALTAALLALGAVAPAFAQSPPAETTAPAMDPVGSYAFLASSGIRAIPGTIEIQRAEAGGYSGEVRLEGESHPAVIQNVVVTGNHMQIESRVANSMTVMFELDFEDDVFAGSATTDAGESIDIDGRRQPPGSDQAQ